MSNVIDITINFRDSFGITDNNTPSYPFAGDVQILVNGKQISLPYSKDFWTYTMQYIFPGVFQKDFDDASSDQSPTMYEDLFSQICEDFYHSFIEGRDVIAKTIVPKLSLSNWANLTDIQKRACFLAYVNTRFSSTQVDGQNLEMVRNLSVRASNIRVWLAYMLLTILEKIQDHTVNVGRAATRYSQTAQAISSEMANNKYNYIPLSTSDDFYNTLKNQTNSKALEDMKTYRLSMQKEVDRESTNLIKANSDAETFTSFINRIVETDLNAIRALFI